jgi:hypothetical protein
VTVKTVLLARLPRMLEDVLASVLAGPQLKVIPGQAVASGVFVAGVMSAQMQQLISGTDLIVH